MFRKLYAGDIIQTACIFIILPLSFLLAIYVSCLAAFEGQKINEIQNNHEIQQLFDQAWSLLGNMHKDKAGLDQALDLYEECLTIDPFNNDVYWKMAEIFFKKADEARDPHEAEFFYKKSIDYSKKSLELDPQSPEAHYWIGCSSARLAEISGVLSAMTLIKQAKNELVKVINIDPDNRFAVLARAVLAAIYTESPWPIRDLSKAREFALMAVEKDPNLTIASEKLAKVYLKAKQYDLALNEINRCLSIKQPTYLWDSILYDWPAVKILLKEINKN